MKHFRPGRIIAEEKSPDRLRHSVEFIVDFVRRVRGDEEAERVRKDPEALWYWDYKIEDWATD